MHFHTKKISNNIIVISDQIDFELLIICIRTHLLTVIVGNKTKVPNKIKQTCADRLIAVIKALNCCATCQCHMRARIVDAHFIALSSDLEHLDTHRNIIFDSLLICLHLWPEFISE